MAAGGAALHVDDDPSEDRRPFQMPPTDFQHQSSDSTLAEHDDRSEDRRPFELPPSDYSFPVDRQPFQLPLSDFEFSEDRQPFQLPSSDYQLPRPYQLPEDRLPFQLPSADFQHQSSHSTLSEHDNHLEDRQPFQLSEDRRSFQHQSCDFQHQSSGSNLSERDDLSEDHQPLQLPSSDFQLPEDRGPFQLPEDRRPFQLPFSNFQFQSSDWNLFERFCHGCGHLWPRLGAFVLVVVLMGLVLQFDMSGAVRKPHAGRGPVGPWEKVVSVVRAHARDLQAIDSGTETEAVLREGALMLSLWILPVGNYLRDAMAIVGFAFGQGPKNKHGSPTPGATNKGLAWTVVSLLKEYEQEGRPRPKVMLQWEIAQVLREEYGIQADVVAYVDASGNYLSTMGVMQQFVPRLAPMGIRTVAVVAHPDHAVRCGKVVQHFNYTALGTRYLLPGGVPWDKFGADIFGYDPASIQEWTVSQPTYIRYELSVRPKMALAGEIDFTNSHFKAREQGQGQGQRQGLPRL